ncbi:hypothetical protein BRETT_001511 [Brettanomyces bruxellensis]|uniref:Uncharacterized protein n=1 Tax=Dekkera bruxellensis TaxID=5007 RepID=A0A871R376_DEKBR|nr:uncharacterized protein BRETT_001511 [Brettanomyces bruxellensis]QOU18068.1 hypothetical protein BRETT_001511 [Brettanomyces bruxellensis]
MDPTHDPDFQPPSTHPKIQPPVSPKLIPNRKPIQPYVLSDDENEEFNVEEDDSCLIDPISLKNGKATESESSMSLPTTRHERATRRKEQSLRHKIPKKATELESSSTSSASASEDVSDVENAISDTALSEDADTVAGASRMDRREYSTISSGNANEPMIHSFQIADLEEVRMVSHVKQQDWRITHFQRIVLKQD